MNKFVQLFYGMLFLITYVIQMQDWMGFYTENEIFIPFFGYKFEAWQFLIFIDWYIKAFASSIISIFPIMFITMSQSYLNNYVKEIA